LLSTLSRRRGVAAVFRFFRTSSFHLESGSPNRSGFPLVKRAQRKRRPAPFGFSPRGRRSRRFWEDLPKSPHAGFFENPHDRDAANFPLAVSFTTLACFLYHTLTPTSRDFRNLVMGSKILRKPAKAARACFT
jgi:hypothetical protein